jgi:hypothetical protein
MKTIDIPMPVHRVVCVVCGIALVKAGQYQDLNVCTTNGVAVLCCTAHAPRGDLAVQAIYQARPK